MSENTNNHRVFVMGVDGATFDIVLPMVERGELPNFQRVIKGGIWGELESVVPPSSGPAWVSFQTGKIPAGHGVFDFVNKKADSYDAYYINSTSIKGDRLWDIIGKHGLKSGVINVMVTYPPYTVNGFLLTGGLTPAGRSFAYPASLGDEVEKRFGAYRLWGVGGISLTDGEEGRFIDSYFSNEKRRMDIARYLLAEKDWDFFMVMLESADPLQHELWKYVDQEHPDYDSAAPEYLKQAIPNFYKEVDSFLGEMMESLGSDTNFLIMSDHGFGPLARYFLVNNFLIEIGMLKLKTRLSNRLKKIIFDRISLERLYRLARKLGFSRAAKVFRGGTGERMLSRLVPSMADIDWSQTRAFAMGASGHVYINVKGREPEGIVTPGPDYNEVRDLIVNELGSVVDPLTGKKAVEKVYVKDDLHKGRFYHRAPDITFLPCRGFTTLHREQFVSSATFIDSPNCGTHTLNGITLFYGPDIMDSGERMEGARIYDLAPTILHLMGIPVPDDMDGCVLKTIYREGSRPAEKAIVYRQTREEDRVKGKISTLRNAGRLK